MAKADEKDAAVKDAAVKDAAVKDAAVKEIPEFRNRTKIDQIVYDESYTTVTVPSGKTIKGEWYRRYVTGKRNCPFVLVDKKGAKDDKVKGATDSKSEE